MTEKKKDLISSIGVLGFAGILYQAAKGLPTRKSVSVVLNTGFYPQMLAIILAVLAVLLLISSLTKKTDSRESEKFFKNRESLGLFLLTLLLLVLFPLGMELLGFIVTCFAFILTMVLLLTGRFHRNVPLSIVVSLGITLLIYGVFKLLLGIPFPSGILF
jgi:putative tricarboxylic transport membrane protein